VEVKLVYHVLITPDVPGCISIMYHMFQMPLFIYHHCGLYT